MRRFIFNLLVAVLTFALGIVASLFLKGLVSTSVEKASDGAVSVERARAPEIISETISTRCGCSQGFDEDSMANDESESRGPISGGVLNGKARSLPSPQYPEIARAAHATGNVPVEILVDERGCVQTARAVGGHPLLQSAAVQAARQACFSPTRLSGHPVKVKGVISYNFLLR
jgi:TonB family protein